jgi:hypothetical protein
VKGQYVGLAAAARAAGLPYELLRKRVNRGKSIEEAVADGPARLGAYVGSAPGAREERLCLIMRAAKARGGHVLWTPRGFSIVAEGV